MRFDFRNDEIKNRFQVQDHEGTPIPDVLEADAAKGVLEEERLRDDGEVELCWVTRDFDVVDLMHGTVVASYRR